MRIRVYSRVAFVWLFCCLASLAYYWIQDGTQSYEESWRQRQEWPQYKYLSRPTYKFVATHGSQVVATVVSFLLTDLLMHQMLPQLIYCCVNPVLPSRWRMRRKIAWYPLISAGWLAMGVPVIYAKYLHVLV